MKLITVLIFFLTLFSCKQESENGRGATEVVEVKKKAKTLKQIKENLTKKGYETFDYVDEKTKDTVLMQQYFIAFLKRGPNRSQGKDEADSLQIVHLAHLGRMYEEGYADISGPFGDDGDIRGITIYNTPTF